MSRTESATSRGFPGALGHYIAGFWTIGLSYDIITAADLQNQYEEDIDMASELCGGFDMEGIRDNLKILQTLLNDPCEKDLPSQAVQAVYKRLLLLTGIEPGNKCDTSATKQEIARTINQAKKILRISLAILQKPD